MSAVKNFLLVLGSQIPVVGVAVAWWFGCSKIQSSLP